VTLQLRPTFSESWYRVKTLKVRLRPSAQISRQYYRGDRWYVVRDPAGNQFHRLSDPAYRFVGLLDGSRTVEEAWDLAGGQLADDAPTQPEVIQILSHLFSANLIDADITPDANVLLRRHKRLSQRKLQGRLMNVLFPRIPLWDPDRFLKTWMPVVRLGFSRIGAVFWLLVVALAVAAIAPMGPELAQAAKHSVDMQNNPMNALWLWAVFVFVKLIHELGHAFACRRFGGECHELGIMFLIFIPTPYVDASTAWGFPSKWQRIFVGAAGMIVEIFFAACVTFFWVYAGDKQGLPAQLAFNAMLVASVSTVVFNANPLLRYDGYYILSDWLEIPNLRQKSTEYSLGLIKRHLFRVKATQPLPPVVQRFWMFCYAITSGVYRIMVGFAIMMLVYFQIPVIGVLMAIGGVATWLIVPVFKTFKYLALEPELHRKRGRAIAYSLAFAATVVVLIGLIRFPNNIDQQGVIEPVKKATIRAQTGGFIASIGTRPDGTPLKDGDPVKAGQVLLVCTNETLTTKIEGLRARIRGLQVELNQSIANDPLKRKIDEDALKTAREQLAVAERHQRNLTVTAPIDGQLICPDIHEMVGRHLSEGQDALTVADPSELEILTLLEQRDSQQVLREVTGDGGFPKTEVRPSSRLWMVLNAVGIDNRSASTSPEVPPAISDAAGGPIATDPSDRNHRRPVVEQFELRVKVNPAQLAGFTPGQTAHVRFKLEKQPLLQQWTRRLFQLIQQHQQQSSQGLST
jgi:putative peptide zinc metalloprotease protein